MQMAVVSDTHVPTRETEIPGPFRERIGEADLTIHAGDFETEDVLEEIRSLSSEFLAVRGNVDAADLGLPAVVDRTVGERRVVAYHGTRNPVAAAVSDGEHSVSDRSEWKRAIADVARARTRDWTGDRVIGIGGHIHEPVDDVIEGVRVLNPGSVTGADPATRPTMQTVTVEGTDVSVRTHKL